MDPFLNLVSSDFAVNIAGQLVKESKHEAINRELRLISGRLERAVRMVDNIERLLGIVNRWQRSDTEYQKMRQYISNKNFVRIVEELQGLVVSRLVELDRVNLAGTGVYHVILLVCDVSNTILGYKLRKHIAQALSRRCTAIRNAIDRYNALAPHQTPPRPRLEYSEVVEYCNFSEFEILKHSDHDLLSKDWTILTNRQAANKYFKLERAKEEVQRCNVEVARLQAWVDRDDAELSSAVAAHEHDPVFAAHLKVVQVQRRQANDRIRMRLQQIYSLPGYSGLRPSVPISSTDAQCTLDGNCRSYYSSLYCVESSHIALTALTAKDDLADIDNDDDDELQNDEDKDEMVRMSDTLAGMII